MSFSATYDRTTRIVTAVVCALTIGLALLLPAWIAAVTAILVIVLPFLWSPRSYIVEPGVITVKRRIGSVRIPLENVREFRPATPNDVSGCIRLMGSGGLFGYYGLFRTSRLGKCTWYVTDRSRMVLLVTDAKTCLFSPDNVEGFFLAAGRPATSLEG